MLKVFHPSTPFGSRMLQPSVPFWALAVASRLTSGARKHYKEHHSCSDTRLAAIKDRPQLVAVTCTKCWQGSMREASKHRPTHKRGANHRCSQQNYACHVEVYVHSHNVQCIRDHNICHAWRSYNTSVGWILLSTCGRTVPSKSKRPPGPCPGELDLDFLREVVEA